MIKKLNITTNSYDEFNSSSEREQFYEIFSNIEQLTCDISEPSDVLLLLNRLPKLSSLQMFMQSYRYPVDFSSFQDEASKRNVLFHIEPESEDDDVNWIEVSIWIENNTN